MREPVDPHWQAVHRALLNKIAYRDRELHELHQDYMALEATLNGYRAFVRRQAQKDRLARANLEAKAAIDG